MKFKSLLRYLNLRWLRGLQPRRTRPIQRSQPSLELELLESRTLLSATRPTIISVTPPNLSKSPSALPPIQVTFSEPMDVADATNTANYEIFSSSGTPIPVNSVSLDPTDTIATITYNSGSFLDAGSYTLLVRGDQLAAAASAGGLTIALPGQIAVANSGSSIVSTVNVPGNGNLGAISQYALPSSPTTGQSPAPDSVQMGDLTGDGLNDLVVLSRQTNEIDIFLGHQSGGFSQTPDYSISLTTAPANNSQALLLGEFTFGVGPDIVVANGAANNVTAFQNQSTASSLFGRPGTLRFGPGQNFAAGTDPLSLTAADFDRDGLLDLAVGNGAVDGAGNFDITILPGVGQSTFFSAAKTIPVGTANSGVIAQHIATGTLDAAGLPDLVAAGTQGLGYTLDKSTGPGNFGFVAEVTLSATSFTSVAVGFLQASSFFSSQEDIAAVTPTGNQLLIFQNNNSPMVGTAAFTALAPINAGPNPSSIVIAPLAPGGSGPNDILITDNRPNNFGSSGEMTVLLNVSVLGNTTFAAAAGSPYGVDGNPVGLVVGDTNGDGNPDAITINNSTGDFTLLQGNGDGTFEVSTNRALPSSQPTAIAVADLNGDGNPDLIFAENNFGSPATIDVMLGNANGGYGPARTYSLSNGATFQDVVSLAIGDITGDGKPDIVALDQQDGTLGILVNNIGSTTAPLGPNSFVAQAPISLSGGGLNVAMPTQILLEPFTAASKKNNIDDVLVSYEGSSGRLGFPGGVALVTNTTTPSASDTFSFSLPGGAITLNSIAATSIAAADFNGDGFVDFVVAYETGTAGAVAVYLNNGGNGSFTELGTGIALHIDAPSSIAVGDLNADGFPDIVVASQSSGSAGGIDVLVNQHGTGFQLLGNVPISVEPGTPLQSVVIDYLNFNSPFPDVLVTAQSIPFFGAAQDNVFVVPNEGGDKFLSAIPYLAGPTPQPSQPPSYAVVADNPLIPVTTFSPTSDTVTVNLITNGNFSAPDLTGNDTLGSLDGWQTNNLPTSKGVVDGSFGQWTVQTGTTSPLSNTPVSGPPDSTFQAMLDEQNQIPDFNGFNEFNPASSYSGTHLLYQDVTIPTGSVSVTLSLSLYVNNSQSFSSFNSGSEPLNYNLPGGGAANQQVRVDIMDTNPNDLLGTSSATGVLANLYSTSASTFFEETDVIQVAADGTITDNGVVTGTITGGLAAFDGQTIRLRIAETNNQGLLIVGVADVQVNATFGDTANPSITNLALRNAGYTDAATSPSNPSADHTTDPTLIGTLNAVGGVNNISFIQVDPLGKNFTSPFTFTLGSNASSTAFPAFPTLPTDALGNFSIPLLQFYNPSPGLQTVDINVVDAAGNSSSTTFTFFYQGPSLTDWQAAGPDNINGTVGQSVQGGIAEATFQAVSGSVTAIATDPLDPSGNTFYIGSENGGVWKTTDGGADWTPLTDFITDSNGNPINVPIGGLAVDPTNPQIIYAATGVGNDLPDSQTGFGVLKSIDGGKTWTIAGNSGTVLAGARTTAVVIGQNPQAGQPDSVYVAVASGGQFGPGVYVSNDGGLTWTNFLTPSSMFLAAGGTVAPGTSLASVTSLIIDPFNSERLIIGMGNIGLEPASATAGVWKTVNNGGSWQQVLGGDQNIVNSTIPSGVGVGRVTVAMGTGRKGDDDFVYVLFGSPPVTSTPNFNAPLLNYGGDLKGPNGSPLYVSDNNMLDFTNVMLRIDVPLPKNFGGGPNPVNYENLNLLGVDASNTGALVVDPTDPNVVYVGTSTEYLTDYGGGPAPFPFYPSYPEFQSFIRVDTGDMVGPFTVLNDNSRPNDGDDIEKANEAIGLKAKNTYTVTGPLAGTYPYKGEGVYWYNLSAGTINGFFEENVTVAQLPGSIQALTFDPQGRLLIGTDEGIWRGTNLGYGYDYTSGSDAFTESVGILDQSQAGMNAQSQVIPPGMTLTDLNSNLQISNVTSVAVDPTKFGVLYTSMFDSGTAGSGGTLTSWTSQGLEGPEGLGVPTAEDVFASLPVPGAVAGSPTTLFRAWEFVNPFALAPESSSDNGLTWSEVNGTAGNSIPPDNPLNPPNGNDPADLDPAFTIDPTPILDNGIFENVLLYGTDQIWITRTSQTVWDSLTNGQPLSPDGGLVTAVTFAPTNDLPGANTANAVYYAGDNLGEVFVTQNNGASWTQINGGFLPNTRVNDIVVDPLNANTAYALFGNDSTGLVFVTNNFGATWTRISGLPATVNSANSMAIVPTANGETIYLATNIGVFDSTNGGASWSREGVGLPNVPVVQLTYNPTFGTLAAATLGRGVFTLATNTRGPVVTALTVASSSSSSLNSVNITFNEPINASTFTNLQVTIIGPNGNVIPLVGSPTVSDSPTNENFQLTFAPQTAKGFYTITIGTGVTDLVGNALYQNQTGLPGENANGTFTGRVLYEPLPVPAPILGNTAPMFPAVTEDSIGSNAGTNLAAWVTSTLAIDILTAPGEGIAITGIDDSKGTWQYSQNSGATWTNIPITVAENNALLLQASANNLIRYLPGPSYDTISFTPGPAPVVGDATFTFRAWDLTTGLTQPAGSDGGFANTISNGGNTAFSSAEGTATIDVLYANHSPTFTMQPGPTSVLENAGLQTIANWTANPNPGAPNEVGQTLSYIVTNSNNNLFAVQPSISINGTLTYQPAHDANGSATVFVWLQDNGGTANGGQNISAGQTFVINITPVNQAPSFTPGPNEETQVSSGLVVVNPWATNVSPGAANESSQTLTFLVSNDNPSLFVVQPSISINGTNGILTYQVGTAIGTAHVTVLLHDNGGTANGGQDTSAPPLVFTITVLPVVSSGSADAVWVSALYRELLQREITPSEVSYWTTLLTGGMSRLAVATQITGSDEYHSVYIKNLFLAYLGRTAQGPDIDYYLQQFHNGQTPNQVKAQILSSGEYYTRNGGTNFGFVSGLYRDVLGESANQDPAGVAFWVMQLSLEVSRATVATDILTSQAANARVIQGAYQLMLNRAATDSDVAYWSGLRDETLEADLANSAEYGIVTSEQNYNSQPDQNWLNHVFQDTLGRTIDPSGISYYILQIRAGVRYPDIVASILNSQEYRTDIATAAFGHILHRQPSTDEVSFYVNLLNEGQTLEQIESEMYGSAEYYVNQGGGTNQGFLEALYRDALNRPLDQAGLDTWGAQLAAVPSLQAVAYAVLTSGEAESDLVAAAYAKYLRRPVDNNGLLYWVGQLENGMTDVQFDAMLIGSPEYYTRFSS